MAPVTSTAPTALVQLVDAAFRAHGVDLARVGMAWARAVPAVTLVPAFGLRAVPPQTRAVLALALAGSIFPAVAGSSSLAPDGPVWVGLLEQVAAGLPVAVAAAVPLWAATMAGGVADTVRGSSATVDAPTVEGTPSPSGALLSLLASTLFFATGGPARIAAALTTPSAEPRPSPGRGGHPAGPTRMNRSSRLLSGPLPRNS